MVTWPDIQQFSCRDVVRDNCAALLLGGAEHGSNEASPRGTKHCQHQNQDQEQENIHVSPIRTDEVLLAGSA